MDDEGGRAMQEREKFVRAEDQQAAAREFSGEMFFDEDETYWVVAEGRTAEMAVEVVTNIEPGQERPSAVLVHGELGRKHGEAWFRKTPDGPVAMWQVGP